MTLRGRAPASTPAGYGRPHGKRGSRRRSSSHAIEARVTGGTGEDDMTTATYPQSDLDDNSLAGAREWFHRKA
jgi:hypothetical protein